MADINITGLEELIAQLESMGAGVDEACRAAARAGAELAVEALRAAVPVSTVHTQHLRDHICITSEAHDAINGHYCIVDGKGTRPGGGSASGRNYSSVGYFLEYGRSNMAARPWLRPTLDREQPRIQEAMAEVLRARLGIGGG